VLVQDVTRFDPSDAEIERAREQAVKAAEPPAPLRIVIDGERVPITVVDDLKRLCEDYPGDCEVVLEVHTPDGPRRLRFGPTYRVAGRNASLKAELDRLLAPARPLALA
jgi:DNA polymerase-3 subunit alpha